MNVKYFLIILCLTYIIYFESSASIDTTSGKKELADYRNEIAKREKRFLPVIGAAFLGLLIASGVTMLIFTFVPNDEANEDIPAPYVTTNYNETKSNSQFDLGKIFEENNIHMTCSSNINNNIGIIPLLNDNYQR